MRIVDELVRIPSANVTGRQISSGDDELADFALSHQTHFLVDEINDAVVQRPSDRHFLELLQVVGASQKVISHVTHHFGTSVEVSQYMLTGRESSEKLFGQRVRKSLAGADPESQRFERIVLVLCMQFRLK